MYRSGFLRSTVNNAVLWLMERVYGRSDRLYRLLFSWHMNLYTPLERSLVVRGLLHQRENPEATVKQALMVAVNQMEKELQDGQ